MNNYDAIIDELLAYEGELLTAWEVEFVDSVDQQRRSSSNGVHGLSEKQKRVLDRLIQKI